MKVPRFGFLTLLALCALAVFPAAAPVVTASGVITNGGNPPVIISPDSAVVVVNTSFNYQIVLANFDSGTYTAQGLAPGLTLDARVGAISGTPPRVGTFVMTLSVTNAHGTGSSTLTLHVVPTDPPEITGTLTAAGLKRTPFSYQITATNEPTGYGAAGLPDGLSVDAATGLISGVPTGSSASSVTIYAENYQGRASATLAINVASAIPMVTLTADTPTANPRRGEVGRFTLIRTGDDLVEPVTVVFSIKGTAANGEDYQLLSVSKTIKAGKAVKRIHVNALLTESGVPGTKKTVKLTLQPADSYTVGSDAVAKVKIYYDP